MEKRLSTLISLYGCLILGATFTDLYCISIMVLCAGIILTSYIIQQIKK